jgi:hypothetical protein
VLAQRPLLDPSGARARLGARHRRGRHCARGVGPVPLQQQLKWDSDAGRVRLCTELVPAAHGLRHVP